MEELKELYKRCKMLAENRELTDSMKMEEKNDLEKGS